MDNTSTPGLLRIKRKSGKTDYYWRADRTVKGDPKVKEYPDQSINLNMIPEDRRPIKCQREKARLLEWLEKGERNPLRFDGTIASLARIYELHSESPFQSVKHGTRQSYLTEAKVLVAAVGKRRIDKITGADIIRWHRKAASPVATGKPRRLRRAQGLVRHLRRIVSFGKMLRFNGCTELHEILSLVRIEGPEPRKEAPQYRHVIAIINEAHKQGRPSIALAQAIMFELTMRQSDVIGQWEPATVEIGGIIANRQRWTSGLVWQDIKGGILEKRTSKTGAIGRWVISEYPLLVQELEKVPLEQRTGPMIIDEHAGRPYFHRHFARVFREIAQAAGVPNTIWSRDFRAGGITEAMDAGANIEQTRQHATHTDIKMTGRYNRGSEKQTAEVARVRAAWRKRQESPENKG